VGLKPTQGVVETGFTADEIAGVSWLELAVREERPPIEAVQLNQWRLRTARVPAGHEACAR